MLETLIAHCGLTLEDIEVSIFNIVHETQAGNDDAQIIKSFIRKHVDTSLTVPETVSKIESELQNFMYGCGNMDVQCDDTRPSKISKNILSSPVAAGSSKGNALAKSKASKKKDKKRPTQNQNGVGGSASQKDSECNSQEDGESPDSMNILQEDEMHSNENEANSDSEITTIEDANRVIETLQITLENSENEVSKNPPTTARQVLSGLSINKQMMTHCITAEQNPENIKQSCASEQKCNYFCFVSRMDPKGSTPQDIVEIIYCLDMMQKYYDSRKKGNKTGRGSGDQIFDVPSAICNNAKSKQKNGAMFHKIYVGDEAITVPILRMKLFVEHASTGGETPLMLFFMFLVVEVPVTFDFVDAIYKSCNQGGFGKEKYISEDMKRLWVNIAHRHQTFSGVNRHSLDSMLRIQFNDIFDPDSPDCFWKMFRIPRCIQQARKHMHMWAMDNIVHRSNITSEIANVLVNIRFGSIDNIFGRQCAPSHVDSIFVGISNLCAAAYSDEFDIYKQRVGVFMENRNKKKGANQEEEADDMVIDNDQHADANGDNDLPVFDPPIVFSIPTYIDWDHDDTSDLLLSMSVNDIIDMSADSLRLLSEHMQKFPQSIKMEGFPITNMVAYIDPSMLLPHSSSPISFNEWLVENKDCALPDQMTIAILVMMHQRKISTQRGFVGVVDASDSMPRNILTLSDLRNSLLCDNASSNKMIYRRAVNIRDKQLQSIRTHTIKTQRGYAFRYYLLGTVYPLSYANARSDTGHYGGKDRVASVLNEIGEHQNTGSEYQSCIAEGFHKAYQSLLTCKNEADWQLTLYPGTLQHTVHMWKASLDHLNRNFRLKANNLQLFFRLQQSDIGVRLCYLVNCIGCAPNGIGLPNYIKNFAGNILRKAKRTNTQFEMKNGKDWGTGADNTMAKFLEAQHPGNNNCPDTVDISFYAPAEDWRGTTEAGTWHAYTVTYDENGKALGKMCQLPIPIYCNEMPAQDSKTAGNSVNIAGRLCSLLPRNTEVDQAGKRTFTIKNEKSGQFVPAVQVVNAFIQALSLAQNCESNNQMEQTLSVVCTTVAAGAVDIDSSEHEGDSKFKVPGYNDMGDSSKFTMTKNDKTVAMCKRIFCHDVRTVCVAVSSSQWRGYFPDSKAGVETSFFDILANYVYMHTSIQSQDARIAAQRGRETQKAQARIPPTALYLHSCNALLHKNIRIMTWADITYNAALNWIADPGPLELAPLFIGTMIENTFDWGFWLVLAMLADFFETPIMDIENVEALFSNHNFDVPADSSQKTRKWLASFGVGKGLQSAATPQGQCDVLFRTDTENDMEKSCIYLTSRWDCNMSVAASALACNIPVNVHQGGGQQQYQSSEQKDISNTSWKVSEQIGNTLFTKYQKQLRSACNISSPEALTIMIYRYMNVAVSYPKFGKPPCGHGFQSWNSILKSLRCDDHDMTNMPHEDSGNFVDGYDARVGKCISQCNHSYQISPWTFINREGSIYSFGVEPRLLMYARSMIAQRPVVSQNSIQSIFDHFVKETVIHRLPSTLYPYTTIFTGMPDPDTMGLSLQVLDAKKVYAMRPTTLVRALPCDCVKEMAGAGISGLIGGQMIEDIACLNKYLRLAQILDMPYKDLHMVDITPPALPFFTWIYVETVIKSDSINPSMYNAGESPYYKSAIYINPDSRTFIRCKSYLETAHDQELEIVPYSEEMPLAKIWQSVAKTISPILDSTPTSFIRYAPIYARSGILVHLETVGYLVLQKWKSSDIKITTHGTGDYYFNPNTMSYLAASEGLDLSEDTSYLSVLQCSFDTYVAHKHESQFDIDNDASLESDYELFSMVKEIKLCLSSRDLEANIVPVGSVLYLDITHQSLAAEIARKLRFSKILHKNTFSNLYGLNVKNFNAKTVGQGTFVPVLECMLLYEMSEHIVPHNDYCDLENQVWIGIRQLSTWSGKHKYTTRYLTVPSKALVSTTKLEVLDISVAIFQSIVQND